ncbi:MAG: signal peptidase I [Acidobacteria bacterium]|nr:MAG: signal peptidase I [Acidobacteriota bacterium]
MPWKAALLGIAVPGLGQLYSGLPLRAVGLHTLLLAVNVLCLAGLFLPVKPWNIAAPLACLLVTWALILLDSVRCAKHAPAGYRLKAYNRSYVYILLILLTWPEGNGIKHFMVTRLAEAFKITNSSMAPTVISGDRLIVNRRAYVERSPRRGDLVTFRLPGDQSELFLKRIIAVGGQVVRIDQKKVYVNGVPLVESYAQYGDSASVALRDDFPPSPGILNNLPPGIDETWARQMPGFIQSDGLHVPPENYFVLGDNRDYSWDSRYWGFVPESDILGKARVIYFSWDSQARHIRWDRVGEILQ